MRVRDALYGLRGVRIGKASSLAPTQVDSVDEELMLAAWEWSHGQDDCHMFASSNESPR